MTDLNTDTAIDLPDDLRERAAKAVESHNEGGTWSESAQDALFESIRAAYESAADSVIGDLAGEMGYGD